MKKFPQARSLAKERFVTAHTIRDWRRIRTSRNSIRPLRLLFIPLLFLILSQVSFAQPALPLFSIDNHHSAMKQRMSGAVERRGFHSMYDYYTGQARSVPKDHLSLLDPSASCNDRWYDGLPVDGVGGSISSIAVDNAGNLYVGGSFIVAGNVIVNNIAKWDGTNWSALGAGTNGYVLSVQTVGTDVYAAGWFTTAGGTAANYVAKWNGSSWSPLGYGVTYPVWDMEISGTDIYVGGGVSGGTQDGFVSKWNGSNWSELGSGFDSVVFEIAVSGADVYAVGSFDTASGIPANHVAKWNGTAWSPLGDGPVGSVGALAVSGSDVYVGGERLSAGVGTVGYVAKWNGSSWSDLGSGMTSPNGYAYVSSLAVMGADVYAAGYQFTMAGETPATGIARWNGSNWSALGPGPGGGVNGITISGTQIYVGKSLYSNSVIAKWDGSIWSLSGSTGSDSYVANLTRTGTDVYASGYFTADGLTYSLAARWNGSGWTPIGSFSTEAGGNEYGDVVAVSGTDVYVGFNAYNQLAARNEGHVYKWNGSIWSELGSGMIGGNGAEVAALAVSGTNVYAGGVFTSAGGTPASGIARWNGSGWSALGSGIYLGKIYTLAVSSTDLYAGGVFSTAGGIEAHDIAKWNGSSWSSMGNPFSQARPMAPTEFMNAVLDIGISGTDVYVAGGRGGDYGGGYAYFTKWNGSYWSLLSNMCCEAAWALAVSGTGVYVGGEFDTANGQVTVNHIGKWNGSGWSSLGSGTNGPVRAIEVLGNNVFVAGSFTTAGCHASRYFARYGTGPGTAFDYDGDGRADRTLRRPSNDLWYLLRTTAGYTAMTWGQTGDLLAPADYDGDGKTDIAVFRPSTGTWFVVNSGNGAFLTYNWGADGDLPVPADHNADGKADLVLFRQSNGMFYRRMSDNSFSNVSFGIAGDKPLIGDFDNDGQFDIGVYRPSNNNWYIRKSTAGFFVQTWGEAGDIPVPADYDGDGRTDLAVWRSSNGRWYRAQSTAGFDGVNWGQAGDTPIPADYDGDGKADVAIFRPSTGTWYMIGTTIGQLVQQFGQDGDVPTPSAFIY